MNSVDFEVVVSIWDLTEIPDMNAAIFHSRNLDNYQLARQKALPTPLIGRSKTRQCSSTPCPKPRRPLLQETTSDGQQDFSCSGSPNDLPTYLQAHYVLPAVIRLDCEQLRYFYC